MLEAFNQYVKKFDLNNEDIKLKYNHSYRVMELSQKYAKQLNYSKEDYAIAQIIGLIHDIGRFEQLKKYNSYDDSKTVDHAELGVDILFNQNLIKQFNIPKKYYEIIKFAIQNHNKINIEQTYDSQKLKHAKLIKDLDKIDILYLLGYLKEIKIVPTNEKISVQIKKDIYNHKLCNLKNCQNTNDYIAAKFAFAFDINNVICLKEFNKNLKYFYNYLNKKEIFEDIYLEVQKYIKERIDRNA